MTRASLTLGFVVALSIAVPAQAPEPPLGDTRIAVQTLVREDIFAGMLQNDMTRLARSEKSIESLLASRPANRAELTAWQGTTALTRAVAAHEAKQPDQFRTHHRRAVALFAEAIKLGPENDGVWSIVGGSYAVLSDRLPTAERAAAWEQGYAAYKELWTRQQGAIAKLPLHHRGELLSGLAQTAQRTGRLDEVGPHLDRLLSLVPDTAYARRAQQWKDEPASRNETRLTCQTCHAPGTLSARLAELAK
jgi:tetratricopeptide (TPR) repeat protein